MQEAKLVHLKQNLQIDTTDFAELPPSTDLLTEDNKILSCKNVKRAAAAVSGIRALSLNSMDMGGDPTETLESIAELSLVTLDNLNALFILLNENNLQ